MLSATNGSSVTQTTQNTVVIVSTIAAVVVAGAIACCLLFICCFKKRKQAQQAKYIVQREGVDINVNVNVDKKNDGKSSKGKSQASSALGDHSQLSVPVTVRGLTPLRGVTPKPVDTINVKPLKDVLVKKRKIENQPFSVKMKPGQIHNGTKEGNDGLVW